MWRLGEWHRSCGSSLLFVLIHQLFFSSGVSWFHVFVMVCMAGLYVFFVASSVMLAADTCRCLSVHFPSVCVSVSSFIHMDHAHGRQRDLPIWTHTCYSWKRSDAYRACTARGQTGGDRQAECTHASCRHIYLLCICVSLVCRVSVARVSAPLSVSL